MEVMRPTDITPQKGRRPSLAKRILLRAKSTSQTGIQLPSPNATPYPELHLFSLPGEIRNHIYSFLFHPEDERDWLERSQIDPHFNHGLNFLRTCRTAYHETHDMAWAGFTPLISPYEHQYKFSIPDKPSRVTIGKSRNPNMPQHSIGRVTVQQYLFWAVYPWWLLEKQGNLKPKEILFQYCLCTKLDELDKDPGKVRSVLDSFDSAARGVKSLERIIVYSCGNLTSFYGRQFSECFKGVESLALQAQDRYILKPIAEEPASRLGSQVEDLDSEEDESQEATEPDEDELWKTSRLFQLIRRRDVENPQPVMVEFISSLDVCGFGCTRDRAKAIATYREARQDSVTRQSTLSGALRSFSIGGSRKDSIA